MSDYETVLVEKKGAVTLVTLNRPQALNALNSAVLRELIAVFADYDSDAASSAVSSLPEARRRSRRRGHQGNAVARLR